MHIIAGRDTLGAQLCLTRSPAITTHNSQLFEKLWAVLWRRKLLVVARLHRQD